jgi:hypothetical protein
MPADQIQQREQINPDDIDQVPVQARVFDRRVVSRASNALSRPGRQSREQAAADDHVQGVHSGHREIEREKEFGFLRIDRDLLAVVIEGIGKVEGGPGTWCFSNFSLYSKPLTTRKVRPSKR